jgi:hypothetical protein
LRRGAERIGHGKLTNLESSNRKIFDRDRFQICFANAQPADDEAANRQYAQGERTHCESAQRIRAYRRVADCEFSKISGGCHGITYAYCHSVNICRDSSPNSSYAGTFCSTSHSD